MLRDDFAEATKRTLANRVGHRCSNPNCQALTSGPQVDEAKSTNIGVAAHIAAAAPGGPRYDATMSPGQRTGISNGIWLCQNCAKAVDNDPARYPADVLSAWKVVAEHNALYHLGKTGGGALGPTIEDRWVSYDYIELKGIAAELKSQGYRLYWAHSHKESIKVEIEGWEVVEYLQEDGRRVRFKVREPDCEYMILLRKKS